MQKCYLVAPVESEAYVVKDHVFHSIMLGRVYDGELNIYRITDDGIYRLRVLAEEKNRSPRWKEEWVILALWHDLQQHS